MDNKKYRILQVHNYYQIPGGEDTVVANEKKLLEEHGHTVIQYTRNNSELKSFSKGRKLLLPFTTIFNSKTYKDIKRIIKEEHIDIVHVHNTLNLISPAVYYAALKCKVPVVQTVHNFRLLCPGATFYRDGYICEDCVEQGLHCAIRHSCYRGSKAQTLVCVVNTWIHRLIGVYGKINYICLTEFNKEKLLQLKQIKLERVFVKPNFVDVGDVGIISYEQRKNQFIFVGRLDKLKGIEILYEAWKLMTEDAPRLIVCGIGLMEDWCRDYIKENDLSTVEMMGFVPNSEAKKLIANSGALILPTQWYEGFPMTIVEAYSVGTPVIGSNIGNVGSLIEEGVSGELFDPFHADDLVKAVNRCCSRTQYDVGIVSQSYTSERNYKKMIEIYSNVISVMRSPETSGGGVLDTNLHFLYAA